MFPKHPPSPTSAGGEGRSREAPSDVEDPRPALKDGGGVWRELGPHHMFLSQETEREREREESGQAAAALTAALWNWRRPVGVGCQHALEASEGDVAKTPHANLSRSAFIFTKSEAVLTCVAARSAAL